ncbi:hypothetical protein [Ralstonia pseudosolanacearum]|uniref:hypothetical protein n=1 Tax=Ralstonia pseudosolanacearum TaxID=1310165 RepID=UPI001FFDE8D1|nr:hypothetical protein [Ralstonia pseudosolanacearum]
MLKRIDHRSAAVGRHHGEQHGRGGVLNAIGRFGQQHVGLAKCTRWKDWNGASMASAYRPARSDASARTGVSKVSRLGTQSGARPCGVHWMAKPARPAQSASATSNANSTALSPGYTFTWNESIDAGMAASWLAWMGPDTQALSRRDRDKYGVGAGMADPIQINRFHLKCINYITPRHSRPNFESVD